MSRSKPEPDERQSQAIVSWTYQWLDAVDRQADRVFTALNTGAGQVEILLFAMALRNVLRGATVAHWMLDRRLRLSDHSLLRPCRWLVAHWCHSRFRMDKKSREQRAD
jgi:hypothetical protein